MKKYTVLYTSNPGFYDFDDIKKQMQKDADGKPVRDCDVWQEIDTLIDFARQDFVDNAKTIFNENVFLLLADCGRWNGRRHGWKIIDGWDDFINAISYGDYITITDRDGRLLVTVCHHDATDYFELKQLTKHGEQLFYCGNFWEHTDKTYNNNINSKFPRLAKTFGYI